MRFAYADPPYIGTAKRRYGDDAREVNHEVLVRHLVDEFDGFALSCSSTTLRVLLPLCPPKARVLAWCKTWTGGRAGVFPIFAWEPVILSLPKGRHGRRYPVVRDWTASRATTLTGTAGAKPEEFCWWLFACAGLTGDDDLIDLFPGSGNVERAWDAWLRQPALPFTKGPKPDGLGLEEVS